MKFYSFILIFIIHFVFQLDKGVHCKIYRAMYENYIKRVVSHIYSQIISYQKEDSNNAIGVDEAFQTDTNMSKFRLKYFYTIGILNFKYIEILKKFHDLINLILSKCHQYHQKSLIKNFISCVQKLEIIVKSSKTMIENLHNAMKFLSYIDIRFLIYEDFMPHPIFDEIDFIYQYVLEKSLETSSFDLNKSPYEISEMKFENLTKFQTDASILVNNFFQNCNFVDTFIINYLKNIKNAELTYDLESARSEILNKFFNDIVEVWYKNLGFEEFLNPNIPEFIPPIDPDTNQNDGIEALNIIRKQSGWEKMNHISIVYFGRKISVGRIINDEVNNINFRIKKEHVSQLLRCRFTEIMKNYRTLLSAMLCICSKDAYHYYHNCLIELFSSFVKSKKMHEDLYEALVTLNKSSIWSVHLSSKSSLYNIFIWVKGFLNLLENNDFSQKNFIISPDNNNTDLVEQFLIIFKKHFNSFSSHLSSELSHYDSRCSMYLKFKDVSEYVDYFRNPENISINFNPEFSNQIMLNACNFYDSFCENVSKFCYEDLGFKKILHCKNKILDRKLH
ncbi:uncharacterized protein LOC126907934 isoform X4 [Daktulosphaira vitifoliae]|uniref:uncharacterized protein LOC126907934 isoform X4 n=1 Tax=Daktulosphaira vitifoliae TaxID=58002 RepID=UPI0021AA0600|nr:uncharacterized protein LOC126907934 isoform X4 [Daktulosphaira vitifoliae]